MKISGHLTNSITRLFDVWLLFPAYSSVQYKYKDKPALLVQVDLPQVVFFERNRATRDNDRKGKIILERAFRKSRYK